MFISVALLGWVPRGKGVLRSGAEAGDAIFVTGELGGSLAGKHLEFEPRLAEARWLAQHFPLHAMLDISDGLAGDLRHILKASRVGAELLATSIPISREARRAAKAESSAKPPLLAALTDGEDFELLFTVASRDAVPLLDAWKKQFPDARADLHRQDQGGRRNHDPGQARRATVDGPWLRAFRIARPRLPRWAKVGPRGGERPGHRPVRRPGRGQDATGQGTGPRAGHYRRACIRPPLRW